VLVVAAASYNSIRARRQLGTSAGTSRLRRTVALELLLAGLVIAATAFLVTTPAPNLLEQP
jgi:putative copper export protein